MAAALVMAALTPRWHPARLSPMQMGYLHSRARVNVVVAGRRSFKTEAAKRRLVLAAVRFSRYPDGRFFATAPTHQQAKDIFWQDLKDLVPEWAMVGGDRRRAIRDGELTIDLANGARIKVAGLDKPQRIEGRDWDGGVVTEFGDCKPNVFGEVIRPMLMRGGWVDLEGTPEGRNHYFEMVCASRDGRMPGSVIHEWTTEEVLHLWLGEQVAAEEIANAQASMDALLYQQEYLARFISLEGQAYYAFDAELNVATGERRVLYDAKRPLILCFDFNRSPGVCAYFQEHPPDRYPWIVRPNPRHDTISAGIGEIFIPRHSNTRKVCERILQDWAGVHRHDVVLHGDATGGAKGSSAVEGSDWEIIRAMLRPAFGHRLRDCVPSENPPVRSRVNAVNTRLVSADGSVGMVLDGKNCPNLIRDFEGVEADEAGEIVKEKGSPLTHISDGVGYYVAEQFPIGEPWLPPRTSAAARRKMAGAQFVPGGAS